jgi:hypothetical protein
MKEISLAFKHGAMLLAGNTTTLCYKVPSDAINSQTGLLGREFPLDKNAT